MNAKTARAIIKQALKDETHDEDPPENDDEAIEVAESLVTMAQDAWDQNVRGPEVEALLKLAGNDVGEDDDDEDEEEEEAPKKKPARAPKGRPAKKKPEPEPEEDAEDLEEPWEDYDSDSVADIVEGVEVAAEDNELDLVKEVLAYEKANKNRAKVVKAAEAALVSDDDEEPEDDADDDEDEDDSEETPALDRDSLIEADKDDLVKLAKEHGVEFPKRLTAAGRERVADAILKAVAGDADDDDADDDEDEAESPVVEEPFEDYDDFSVSDLKEAISDLVDTEEDEEYVLEVVNNTIAYETANDNRKSLVKFLNETLAKLTGDEDEEEEPEAAEDEAEEEVEAEEPEAAEDDGADEAPRRSKGRGKKAGSSAGAGSAGAGDEEGDDEVTDLIDFVHKKIETERLHVPAPIEEDLPEVPFDLSSLSDAELQRTYMQFSAYSYRAGYLLMVEEAKSFAARNAADEIVEKYIAEDDGDDTVTEIKARAEQHPDVKVWRRRQKRWAILAESQRKQRDSYDKICERLSRLETMRQNEWERAGAKSGSGSSRPARKSK